MAACNQMAAVGLVEDALRNVNCRSVDIVCIDGLCDLKSLACIVTAEFKLVDRGLGVRVEVTGDFLFTFCLNTDCSPRPREDGRHTLNV